MILPIYVKGCRSFFYKAHNFTVIKKLCATCDPFSSLSYQLATGKEQMIKATHTQNPNANFNFGFDYRLITAPGLFVTQNYIGGSNMDSIG